MIGGHRPGNLPSQYIAGQVRFDDLGASGRRSAPWARWWWVVVVASWQLDDLGRRIRNRKRAEHR